MTDKEKAQAYDEALERAKDGLVDKKFSETDDTIRSFVEYIFPQLRESKDERTRKNLVALVEAFGQGKYKNEMLAYLEKQKPAQTDVEREYVRTLKSLISDFLYGKEEVDREYYQQIYDWLDGRHIEQKPADDKAFEEWIDDWWKHNKVNNPDSYDKGDEIQFDERGFKNFCRGIRNMYAEQKPMEWSEEDERMFSRCIKSIECSKQFADSETYKAAKDAEMNWFKSLPERFNLQPKNEWSEKDERMKNRLIDRLNFIAYRQPTDATTVCMSFESEIDWLKSLPKRFSYQTK